MNGLRRGLLVGVGIAGAAVSGYAYLYQVRIIEDVACPGFGTGCSRVLRSRYAYSLGVPDAIFGVMGYAAVAALAALRPERPGLPQRLADGVLPVAGGLALGVSALLTYFQAVKLRAWCTWCLLSAALSSVLFLGTLPELRQLLRKE